jgi:replicative DNA helicase
LATDPSLRAGQQRRKSGNEPGRGWSQQNGGQNGGGLLPNSSPDIHTRSLPHSVEAEQGVLGSMLIAPREIIAECVEKINEEYFYFAAHQTIYAVLVELWNVGQGIDLITFTQVLRDRNLLETVGGAAAVTSLFTFVPTAANVTYYLEIVREKYILRQIIAACTEGVRRSFEEQDQVDDLLDEVEHNIFVVGEDRFKGHLLSMREHVVNAVEAIEKIYERQGAITGISTGFADLDRLTSGLHSGEMFVVAGRPSMGKTAFAMNIAEHAAVEADLPVAVFSLEMSSQQLVQRLLCSRAKVNLKKLKEGFLRDVDFRNITESASKLSSTKMFIDDTSGLSILELRAKARRLKAQHDIQLIVVDYLQLLRSTTRRAQENRQLEIAEISGGLKSLAKELNVPVVVAAQLNRNPENRSGDRKGVPMLSDLRESGTIEQDADVVGLLYREDYYADDEKEKEEARGKAELILAKQRNGPAGEHIKLTFISDETRFEDRAEDEDADF